MVNTKYYNTQEIATSQELSSHAMLWLLMFGQGAGLKNNTF